jgi:hypothetical protein
MNISSNFDLDRGDAQGNTPSPILYNMAQQIFLFKLEMCPEIKSVFVNHLIPRPIAGPVMDRDPDTGPNLDPVRLLVPPPPDPVPLPVRLIDHGIRRLGDDEEDVNFRNESNKETDKAEGFADDTTGLTIFELESLAALKRILIEFGIFSGLQCNVEKTVLMQVGNRQLPSDEILALGFTLVVEIKILGMKIDHALENLDSNFVEIHDSIKNTIGYWKRHNLSMPGRINVAKSLLVSLLNYLGCFMQPKPHTLSAIQKSIDDFILGSDTVARFRLYLPVESGGLGCFKLDDFLGAQQCVWPLRAELSSIDNWRVNIRKLSHGNCLGLSWRNIDVNLHPILYGFGKSMEKLRTCHDSSNENYLHATVLYNPLIFRGPGNKLTLDPDYLEIDKNPDL